jgi:hypothetical protein
MGLVLCNRYPTTIETSIMFYSPESCGGEGGQLRKDGLVADRSGVMCSRVCQRS